jgi:hypothetical protein
MGTFGVLSLGAQQWYTVERPWENNKPSISCIPAGTYEVKLGMYYSGDGPGGKPDYPAYEILNVPGRALIKIHKGNRMLDVKGCVALGKDLGADRGDWCVLGSREAFSEFMTAAAVIDPHEITITWAEPET